MADLKVRDVITLRDPNGKDHTAKWAGGTRSVKKRLATYAYAGVNGQVADDYGSDSVTYPINIIFDDTDVSLTLPFVLELNSGIKSRLAPTSHAIAVRRPFTPVESMSISSVALPKPNKRGVFLSFSRNR